MLLKSRANRALEGLYAHLAPTLSGPEVMYV